MGDSDYTVGALRARGIAPAAIVLYLAMPQTASWKTPPSSLEEIVDRVDLRRVSRRPVHVDLRALELLSRRLSRGS